MMRKCSCVIDLWYHVFSQFTMGFEVFHVIYLKLSCADCKMCMQVQIVLRSHLQACLLLSQQCFLYLLLGLHHSWSAEVIQVTLEGPDQGAPSPVRPGHEHFQEWGTKCTALILNCQVIPEQFWQLQSENFVGWEQSETCSATYDRRRCLLVHSAACSGFTQLSNAPALRSQMLS